MLLEIQPMQTCPLTYNHEDEIVLKHTDTYVLEDTWAKKIQGSKIAATVKQYNIDMSLENGKSVLFIRSMGMGDMLFMSPVLEIIKCKYPNCKLGFASVKSQHSMLEILPNIDEIVEYPIKKQIFDSYDYHFTVSGLIEGNSSNINKNIYQVYLEHLGISTEDFNENSFKPIINKDILIDVNVDDNLIGIHPFAIDPIRQLNLFLVSQLIDNLLDIGQNIIIFSNRHEQKKYSHLFSTDVVWSIDKACDMKYTARDIASCKLIISSDSVITHLAQAIRTKCIAIYGPFPSISRVSGYDNITVIDNNPDCRCAQHQIGQCPKQYRTPPCLTFDISTIMNIISNTPIQHIDVYEPEIVKYNWGEL